jgi:hypothetical protein
VGTRKDVATIAGAGLFLATLVGVSATANADGQSDAKRVKPPVVKITGTKSAVKLTTKRVAPGPIQFNVKKAQGGATIDVLATDKINKVVQLIPRLQGDTAAAAVTKLNKIATLYGGSRKGGVWQVDLPKGRYYALNIDAAFGGKKVATKFRVKGAPNGASMHRANASLTAVGANASNTFKARGLGRLGSGWIKVVNDARELHFFDLSSVTPDTTNAVVRESLNSPDEPDYFTGTSYYMDVLSPGIKVVWRGPFDANKYLLACWMPSENDGMPHALMGMWKLVTIG